MKSWYIPVASLVLLLSLPFLAEVRAQDDSESFVIRVADIEQISADHKYGSIHLSVKDTTYLYVVQPSYGDESPRILAVSAFLRDLRNADRLQGACKVVGPMRRILSVSLVYDLRRPEPDEPPKRAAPTGAKE
jgi:hypothetical protein